MEAEAWKEHEKQALVIVHPSSLDAFTDAYGSANGAEVASQLFQAIEEQKGLDQG